MKKRTEDWQNWKDDIFQVSMNPPKIEYKIEMLCDPNQVLDQPKISIKQRTLVYLMLLM